MQIVVRGREGKKKDYFFFEIILAGNLNFANQIERIFINESKLLSQKR